MARNVRGEAPSADRPGPGAIVEEVLERWPETAPVFMRLKMACVGCDIAGFETLAEAAAAYGIAVERLLGDLYSAVRGRGAAEEAQ